MLDSCKPCPCGSGMFRLELYDARGIFCTYYCDKCEKEKRAQFRPDIFTNPNYECDEPIEPEEY